MRKVVIILYNEHSKVSKKGIKYFLKELSQWFFVIVLAVVITLFIKGFIFEPTLVNGKSMEDTMQNDQILIAYKLGYITGSPEKKDIVIFPYQEGIHNKFGFIDKSPFLKRIFPSSEDINYIKRVIALPGDEVSINDDGYVYVNGERLIEPYAKGKTYRHSVVFPLKVTAGKVFVLGDNREYSKDSREIGLVDIKNIKSKAVLRLRPFENFGMLH